MVRMLIIIAISLVLTWVSLRVWRSISLIRSGAIPPGHPIPEVPLATDRGWQVTRSISRDECTVQVEHPDEGVLRRWTVNVRAPGAMNQLEQVMTDAGGIVRDLSRDIPDAPN